MLNLDETVFVQGRVVGVKKEKSGRLIYTVEVPDDRFDGCTERIDLSEDNEALVTSFTLKTE